MKRLKCEFCEGTVEPAVRCVPFRYKKETTYIDNVPVRVCRRCGEIYYEAEVYRKLEKIAANRQQIKSKVTFRLADHRMGGAP